VMWAIADGGNCPLKNWEKIFSGKNRVKFGHFVNFFRTNM